MAYPAEPSREGEARDGYIPDPIPDPEEEARLDQIADHEAWAEQVDQVSRGIPWADGPDATYEEMDRRDALRAEPEAEAEAEPF